MDLSAKFFRLLFPSAIFQSAGNHVYLTFDDGPHPVATPAVLEILRQFDARATFFVTGSRVREFPGLVRRMIEDNHRIGNHAFHHKNIIFQPRKAILEDIRLCNQAVTDAVGLTPTLFRPPFGYYDRRVLSVVRTLGMRLVHWSHDVRDFTGKATPHSMHRIAERVAKGSILLLHDNDSTASSIPSYLPSLVESLKTRGFTFDALD
jgi:peptidoglycan-N-acetylglucosamine deacetylase